MYLKCIEVQGFKSFANRIRFDFQNGITGIVGPNGSGKSNVADAIRWVFGEQSAKQLRGSSMQDVIFAGTQLRKPQSYASVSITLDNADRALAMDSDEVTVTRKVFRSGDSEYLLNGSNCRLKDINELFYDTGIGKEGYSLIGQGQVEKILNGKAEERRELFDEACGIVKFKRRKLTAMRRLENEHANMVRVTDILSELERQVGPLARQSENAREYLRLRDELRIYDVNAFLLDQAHYTSELERSEEALSNTEAELLNRREEDNALRAEYSFLDDAIRDLEEKLAQSREKQAEAANDRADSESRAKVLEEQINTENMNLSHYEARVHAITAQREEKEEGIRGTEEEKRKNSEALLALYSEKDRESSLESEYALKLELVRKALTDAQGKTIDLLNEKSEVNARLQALETLISQNELRKEEQNTRLRELRHQAEELFTRRGRAEEDRKSVERTLNEKNEELTEAVSEQEEAEAGYSETQRKLLEAGQKYQIMRSRYETLRGMAERYEGFNSAVKRVMDEKKKFPGVLGVVSDILRVEQKYRTAIETALGGNIQNVVVETEADAKKLVAFLKENRAGRATFLPLDSITPQPFEKNEKLMKEPGVLGTGDTLVSADPKYGKVIRFLLERVLVVDTLDHATAAARKYHYSVRMVTLDGESLAAGGSITGGAFKNNSNILGRNDELTKLEKQAESLKKEQEDLNRSLSRMRQLRESAKTEVVDLQEEIRDLTIRAASVKADLDSTGRSLALLSTEEKEIKARLSDLTAEAEKAVRDRDVILSSMEELKKANSDSDTSVSETKRMTEEAEKALNDQKQKVADIALRIASLEQSDGYLAETVERLTAEIGDLNAEYRELSASREEALEKIGTYREDIDTCRTSAEQALLRYNDLTGTVRLLENRKEEFASSQREFFDRRDSLNSQIADLTREQLRLQSLIEKAEEKLDSQTEYLWSEYELTPSEAVSYRAEELTEMGITQIRRHSSELKAAVKALGNINVNAIEQYKEVSGRYEFLKTQYDDLKAAEDNLTGIIQDLDEGMRKQFTEQFAAIRTEYDRVFRELFGGGAGTLLLQEGVDVIDSDISIISQPPGKKLQNMMQLSGGEKALSAIALLFAIQNLKPSPFCLLDEIEAALDDSNVGRFTGYLRKLSDQNGTQFIVITHRRGTMVATDRLYGITMQEKGVSALVSVSLVEQDLDN